MSGLTAACCVPPPPASHEAEGKIDRFVGLDVYVTGPSDATKAVILATDLFGWEVPNLRKLADQVGKRGYLVVVPDYFKGESLNNDDWLSRVAEWLPLHHPLQCVDVTKELIEFLKKEKGVTSVGIAGFCWGAKLALKVADGVKAIVLLHPSILTEDDFEEITVPLAILPAASDEVLEKFGTILDGFKEKVDIFVKVYPQEHGWTTRYDPEDEQSVKAALDAQDLLLGWFEKYV